MSTTIIAIRHAKPKSEGYADERLRPLHDEGIATQRAMAQLIADKGYSPNSIYSSPILRAVQTAEILAEKFSLSVNQTEALGYGLDRAALLSLIPPPDKNQALVLVGHAPNLAEFINDLVGDIVLPEGLSKSGAAILSFNEQPGIGKATFVEYLKP